jgi:hypothetical protein
MQTIADRSAIRQAVERIRENLAGIEADRNLSTPQTIAHYLWLIDYELLNKIEPIDRVYGILISSFENQIITRKDQETTEKFCRVTAIFLILLFTNLKRYFNYFTFLLTCHIVVG